MTDIYLAKKLQKLSGYPCTDFLSCSPLQTAPHLLTGLDALPLHGAQNLLYGHKYTCATFNPKDAQGMGCPSTGASLFLQSAA